MTSGLASDTAHLTARARAADAVLEPGRRLLDDRFAALFVSEPPPPATSEEALQRLTALDKAHGGFIAEILLRQRFFEDHLDRAVQAGVRQVLLLGAGFDSTALRRPATDGLRWFEVDHPATQKAKLDLLHGAQLETPQVTYVPVDFEAATSLGEELTRAGFDASQPAVVGWLGVSFFLRPEAFRRTLDDLAATTAPGSVLVLDYMDQTIVDGTSPYRGALEMARKVGEQGEPYINGFTVETLARTLQAAGFRPTENLRVPGLVSRYGGADPYCNDDDFMGVFAAECARTATQEEGAK